MGKKNNIHAKRSKAEHFFEKIYNKGPKIHCLALKLYTGASKSRGQESFLLKSAMRCIRDNPYLRQGGHDPLPPPPWIRYCCLARVRHEQTGINACLRSFPPEEYVFLLITAPQMRVWARTLRYVQWWIQDFPKVGAPTYYMWPIFPKIAKKSLVPFAHERGTLNYFSRVV